MCMNISMRQKEIICMAADGKTNKEIAFEVDLSINTVKYHRKEIFLKLGVSSMSEVIKVYYEEDFTRNYPKV